MWLMRVAKSDIDRSNTRVTIAWGHFVAPLLLSRSPCRPKDGLAAAFLAEKMGYMAGADHHGLHIWRNFQGGCRRD